MLRAAMDTAAPVMASAGRLIPAGQPVTHSRTVTPATRRTQITPRPLCDPAIALPLLAHSYTGESPDSLDADLSALTGPIMKH